MDTFCLLDDEMVSPLGFSTAENVESLLNNKTGIRLIEDSLFGEEAFYGSRIPKEILNERFLKLGNPKVFTHLEKMMILAINRLLQKHENLPLDQTLFVLSTTKGNVDTLSDENDFSPKRAKLYELGKVLQQFFKLPERPVIVSNACISGGLALATAKRLMETQQKYKYALVVGGDLLSKFTLSGFQSFKALDDKPCQPFSENRNGLNLGEAAAAVLMGRNQTAENQVALIGAASANDANHISGPSRTGQGLVDATNKAFEEASISSEEIQYISAHGTATHYNDEMEAIALNRLGLSEVPVNSFKGYYGHTLGASALLESILTVYSLKNQQLFASAGFQTMGVSKPIAVIQEHKNQALRYALKTASGFGGCNLALIFEYLPS